MESISKYKGFTTNKFIDPNTGEVTYKYYWKRNEAPKIEITGPLVKRLAGYTLIQKDLVNCLKWIQQAKALASEELPKDGASFYIPSNRDSFNIVKALFVASLTFYGKCFTKANGRGAQVSRDWLLGEYKKNHDNYMKYRHNFAAHSGDEEIEIAKTFVLLHPKKKNEYLQALPVMRLQPDLAISLDLEEDFEALIQYVITLVEGKAEKLSYKIINELILPRGIDFWRLNARKNQIVTLGYPRKSN